jgi:Tfp pilus assembly protein PilN
MIHINLLDSVTEQTRGVARIESRVSSPSTRLGLTAAAVCCLMFLAMGLDWMSARTNLVAAQAELSEQQELARQMDAIKKEQVELEKKTKEVQTRIDAIRRLRSSQKGPVAVLSSINERLPKLSNFYLTTIEQKGEELTIMGNSPNEMAVTGFGRSLEFSSGLFANVNIETQRQTVEVAAAEKTGDKASEKEAPKPETVVFTIKCKYTAPGQQPQQPAQQSEAADLGNGKKVLKAKDGAQVITEDRTAGAAR